MAEPILEYLVLLFAEQAHVRLAHEAQWVVNGIELNKSLIARKRKFSPT
ncbi:MAG: hypothetical protein O6949_11030 [Chloroflexi bacterium]|nr:hypothetical protein [Chloroflexota bacterium]